MTNISRRYWGDVHRDLQRIEKLIQDDPHVEARWPLVRQNAVVMLAWLARVALRIEDDLSGEKRIAADGAFEDASRKYLADRMAAALGGRARVTKSAKEPKVLQKSPEFLEAAKRTEYVTASAMQFLLLPNTMRRRPAWIEAEDDRAYCTDDPLPFDLWLTCARHIPWSDNAGLDLVWDKYAIGTILVAILRDTSLAKINPGPFTATKRTVEYRIDCLAACGAWEPIAGEIQMWLLERKIVAWGQTVRIVGKVGEDAQKTIEPRTKRYARLINNLRRDAVRGTAPERVRIVREAIDTRTGPRDWAREDAAAVEKSHRRALDVR